MASSVFPKPLYLGAATRTPIGRFGGALKQLSAVDLAEAALKEAQKRAPDLAQVDWVFLGNARQAGVRPNPARQTTFRLGWESIPAITINQACASGMASVFWGLEKIALGQASSVWAGGTESMSNTPYLLTQARWGVRLGHSVVEDGMIRDGFHCPLADQLMGSTVEEFIAKERGISRKEQDSYALQSQERAENAWKNGNFAAETFEIPGILTEDEHRRPETTLQRLAQLPPVFDAQSGSVTAGNSSGITDGAAWVHISNQQQSHTQVEILDYQTVALDPRRMGLGPIPATQTLLKRQNLSVDDLEVVEINEAFAAQVLACQRELRIPEDKLNPRGGSIAIGHPIGATGARILVTLIHQLQAKPGSLGLATLCVSGGQGTAILVRSIG